MAGNTYETKYLFKLEVDGADAVKAAQDARRDIDAALNAPATQKQQAAAAQQVERLTTALNEQAKAAQSQAQTLRAAQASLDSYASQVRQAAAAQQQLTQATSQANAVLRKQVMVAGGAGRGMAGQPLAMQPVTAWPATGRYAPLLQQQAQQAQSQAWLQAMSAARAIPSGLPNMVAAGPALRSDFATAVAEQLTPQQLDLITTALAGPLPNLQAQGIRPLRSAGGGGVGFGGMQDLPPGFDVWGALMGAGGAGGGGGGILAGMRRSAAGVGGFFNAFNEGVTEATRNIWALRRAAYGIEAMGATMIGISTAMSAAIYKTADAYLEFDAAATRAQQAMQLQTDLIPELRQGLMDTAEEVGKFDAVQIAEGVRLWAAGTGVMVETESQLNQVLAETVDIQKLAALNAVELGGTVENVGGIMHEFGMTTKDVSQIVAVLDYVAAESFANVDDLGQAFRMVGPIAHSMGVSFEEAAAAMALLSDENIKGTMLGRAVRQMFIRMLDPSKEYNEVMDELLGTNAALGESWQQLVFPEGEFMGFGNYIELLADSVADLTTAEKNRRLAMLATANELPALTSLVNTQIEYSEYGVNVISAYTKAIMGVKDAETARYEAAYESITGLPFALEGALARMTGRWEQYLRSDSYRVDRLKQQWQNAAIEIGQTFTQTLLPRMEELSDTLLGLLDRIADDPAFASMAADATVALAAMGVLNLALGMGLKNLANIYTIVKGFATATNWLAAGNLVALLAKLGAGPGVLGAAGVVTGAAPAILPVLTGALATAILAAVDAARVRAERAQAYETLGLRTRAEQELLQETRPWTRGGETRYVITGPALLQQAREMGIEPLRMAAGRLGTAFYLTEEQMEQLAKAVRETTATQQRMAQASEEYADYLSGLVTGQLIAGPTITGTKIPQEWQATEAQMEVVGAYEGYLDDRQAAWDVYNDRARDIRQAYNEWEIEAEADKIRRIADLHEDWTLADARRLEDQQRSGARRLRDYNEQVEKAAKDHFDRLRALELAHRDRMIDLLEARDVQGITKEQRAYRRQLEEQQKSYDEQAEERERARRRQLEDEEEDRRIAAERREEDRQRQLDDINAAFEEQRAARQAQRQKDMAEAETEREKTLAEVEDTWEAFLASIGILGDRLNEYYKALYLSALIAIGNVRAAFEEAMGEGLQAGEWFIPPGTDLPQFGMGEGIQPYPVVTPVPDTAEWMAQQALRNRNLPNVFGDYGDVTAMMGRGLEDRTTSLLRPPTGTQQQFIYAPVNYFNGMGSADKQWYMDYNERMMQDWEKQVVERTGGRSGYF